MLIAGIFVALTLFLMNTMTSFITSTGELVERQNAVTQSTQHALISLDEANVAIEEGLSIDDPQDLEKLRLAESKFSAATTRFEMFINSLIWGSESDAFKRVNGGIAYEEWKRLRLDQSLRVFPLDAKSAQIAGEVDIFFGSFSQDALATFAAKRKQLRLSDSGENLEVKNELVQLSTKLRERRIKIASLVNNMIENYNQVASSQVSQHHDRSTFLNQATYIISTFGFMMALLLGILFSRLVIVQPILELAKVAQAFSSGDFSQKVGIKSKDELGYLGLTINNMATKLSELYANLEEQVKQRTTQLNNKVVEIEQMNKMMIGRELKMVELKKQIAALQNEVSHLRGN